MAAEQEVAGLLEAALAIERECDETKKQINSKRRERGNTEHRIMAAAAENGKELETNVDGLLARMTLVQDELELLRREHAANAEKQRAALQKADGDTEEVRESLHRLRTMLTMRQNPGNAQMLTPPIAFTMDNFEERKANDETWYSPPFYSHHLGYKMCLRVYPNGNGDNQGTHVSAFIAILPGEFDDLLSWPFCGEITIQLLNQRKSSRDHISKVVGMTGDNSLNHRQRVDPVQAGQLGMDNLPVWGFTQFAAHNDVCAPRGYFAATEYLKEDKLVFRVWKVDTFFLHH